MTKILSFAAGVVLATTVSLSYGDQATHPGMGTVQAVDRTKGEVILMHEPIGSLNWPAMTMNFQVKESRLFDRLQSGRRVAFEFVAEGNRYVVTSVIPFAEVSAASQPSQAANHQEMGMMGSSAMQAMMKNCMTMMQR